MRKSHKGFRELTLENKKNVIKLHEYFVSREYDAIQRVVSKEEYEKYRKERKKEISYWKRILKVEINKNKTDE